MGDLAKALTSSFSKFVFAWLLPSALTLGLAWLFLVPTISSSGSLSGVLGTPKLGTVESGFVFLLLTVASAVLFAYAALPIYRLLEGYSLPRLIREPLRQRQLRRWRRLQDAQRRWHLTGRMTDPVLLEKLATYPRNIESVRATRLGNALSAMESFAADTYGFDSQILWYELMGVVPEGTRRDAEESRSPVDFFVSLIAHAMALAVAASAVAVAEHHWTLFSLAALALLTVPGSYKLALSNTIDWGASVKAVANLGRLSLAERLGLNVPAHLEDEQNMWRAYTYAIEYHLQDRDVREAYDSYRTGPSD